MGLTRQYLRYAPTNVFGIIAGARSNLKMIKYKSDGQGKYAAVGACELVFIWDLKKAEIVSDFISQCSSLIDVDLNSSPPIRILFMLYPTRYYLSG
jgi:hypothetical protein